MEVVNELDIDGYRWKLQDLESRKSIVGLTADIGDLSKLATTEKGNLVEAINEMNKIVNAFFYPTGEITAIEIGENGDAYIAPSDGFVQANLREPGYVSILTSNPANSESISSQVYNNVRIKTFVKKGEEYRVYYSGDKTTFSLKHYALM